MDRFWSRAVIAAIFILIPCSLASASPIEELEVVVPWTEDVQALAEALIGLHPRVDWITPRDRFDWNVDRTARRVVEAKTEEQRIVALMELIASVRDGHTVLSGGSRYNRLGWLPFSAIWRDDGMFLRTLPEAHAEVLGAKILAVDGMPIDLVLERLRRVVPHAAEGRFRRWAPAYLHLPGLLFGLGITGSPDVAALRVRLRDGRVTTLEFARTTEEQEDAMTFKSLEDELADRLVRYREREKLYRLEPLSESRALYVNYRRMGTDEKESPWAFAARLIERIENDDTIDRLVIDLRDNGGGGYQWVAHLGPLIANVERINRPGGLYVLIGQKTFSAAISWANWLRLNTAAIFVGRSAGDRPNSPGDDDPFILPNSGLEVNISRKFHKVTFPGDDRHVWLPDIDVAETMADLLNGRDAALEVALSHRAEAGSDRLVDEAWLGRYRFDHDADLVIGREDGRLVATVTPRIRLLLRQTGRAEFSTPIDGWEFTFDPKGRFVTTTTPGGQSRRLDRLEDERRTGWEHFLAGRYDEAEAAFREVLASHPDHPPLADGNLPSEAIHLVFRVRPSIGTEASRRVGAELLRMGMRLHPDGAPDCEFSLRFYE